MQWCETATCRRAVCRTLEALGATDGHRRAIGKVLTGSASAEEEVLAMRWCQHRTNVETGAPKKNEEAASKDPEAPKGDTKVH